MGSGAQGNFSLTTMLTRTPSWCGSQYTFTSANKPEECRRSRTMSSVSGFKSWPMERPAMERTVSSSVRTAFCTRTSVMTSSTAHARAALKLSASAARQTRERMRPPSYHRMSRSSGPAAQNPASDARRDSA